VGFVPSLLPGNRDIQRCVPRAGGRRGRYPTIRRHNHSRSLAPVLAYFTFDLRAAWRYKDWLELSVVGENLWENQHSEFGVPATRENIPRSVYGKVTFQF
jgi:hypothetical protein